MQYNSENLLDFWQCKHRSLLYAQRHQVSRRFRSSGLTKSWFVYTSACLWFQSISQKKLHVNIAIKAFIKLLWTCLRFDSKIVKMLSVKLQLALTEMNYLYFSVFIKTVFWLLVKMGVKEATLIELIELIPFQKMKALAFYLRPTLSIVFEYLSICYDRNQKWNTQE